MVSATAPESALASTIPPRPRRRSQDSEEAGFAQEEAADLGARGAQRPQDANLDAPASHGGGDGVVDQEDADEQGDHAQGGEIELECGEHVLDLETALARGLGAEMRRKHGVQARATLWAFPGSSRRS
jgi:hypothetical protein